MHYLIYSTSSGSITPKDILNRIIFGAVIHPIISIIAALLYRLRTRGPSHHDSTSKEQKPPALPEGFPPALPAEAPESELKLNLGGVNYDFGLKKPKSSISEIFSAFWKTSLILFLAIIILGFVVAIIGAVINASNQITSKEIVRQNPPQFTPTPDPTPASTPYSPANLPASAFKKETSNKIYKNISNEKGAYLQIRDYPHMNGKILEALDPGHYRVCILNKVEVYTDSNNLKWRLIAVNNSQGWVLESSLENP